MFVHTRLSTCPSHTGFVRYPIAMLRYQTGPRITNVKTFILLSRLLLISSPERCLTSVDFYFFSLRLNVCVCVCVCVCVFARARVCVSLQSGNVPLYQSHCEICSTLILGTNKYNDTSQLQWFWNRKFWVRMHRLCRNTICKDRTVWI